MKIYILCGVDYEYTLSIFASTSLAKVEEVATKSCGLHAGTFTEEWDMGCEKNIKTWNTESCIKLADGDRFSCFAINEVEVQEEEK